MKKSLFKYVLNNNPVKFFLLILLILIIVFVSEINFQFSFLNSIKLESLWQESKSFKKIEVINTLTPTLRWFKAPETLKYQLVIKEFEGHPEKTRAVLIRTFEVIDTFFVVPFQVLEQGKYYSWNVKSFNGKIWSQFGDEYYFRIDLKSSYSTKIISKPQTVTPGKLYPYVEEIQSLNPQFKWYKLENSTAYHFNIEKKLKDGSYKKIFSSDEVGLINDTIFTLQGNLLSEGMIYRWNVKSMLPLGSQYSDFRYFKITLPSLKIKPQGLYPGYEVEDREIIATTTPTFIWKKINGAEFYSIAISKKEVDGNYKLIFDSEGQLQIRDTLFQIPKGLLLNNTAYRWNLKVHLKDGRFLYSPRLFFKVIETSPQTFELTKKNEPDAEYEELLLNMEYAGIVKTLINSIYYNNKIYVSINEFFDNLKIPITKNEPAVIEGYLDEPKNLFLIDFDNRKFSSKDTQYYFNNVDFLIYNEEYFISRELLEKILSLKIDLDFSNLTIYISSDKPLQIYTKFLIEQKFLSMRKREPEKVIPLLFNRERYLLNGFVFDYTLSQNLLKRQKSNYFYSVGLGGEFLYGDFYYSRREFLTSNYRTRIDNYNWKYTLNPNEFLSQISIGDEFVDGISSYIYRGINITNEPVEPRKKIGTYLYQDKTDPNSLIELYVNNDLLDIAKSDQVGNFLFEIPLRYGMSNLEFRVHTPLGETKIFRKLFQVPYELLPKGVLHYKITSGLTRFENKKLFYSDLNYGVADFLTVSTGGEFVEDTLIKKINYFLKSVIRVSSNILFNFFYSPSVQTNLQGSIILPNYTSYAFEFVNFERNKFYNPSNLKNSLRGSFYLPFKLNSSEFSFYLFHDHLSSNNFKKHGLSLNTFFLYKWLNFNAGLSGENLYASSIIKRRELIFGAAINFNNLFRNTPIVNRSYIGVRSNYNLSNNRFQNFSIFTTTTIFKNLRVQFNYEKLFLINSSNLSLNLFFELPQTRYVINSNMTDVIGHQISGSMGYSPQFNQFYFYSEPLIGRTSVYLEGYEDKNSNNLKDEDEKNIKRLDFSINSASYSKNLKDGKIFVGLNPYQQYIVNINESAMLNPNYSFQYSEFSFVTDGNRLKVLRLPYTETGEVGGLVVRNFGNDEIPLANVRLIIKNLDFEKEISISTFSDGSFYFFGLTKGKYIIKVDENYVQKLSLTSKPEKIEFEINPERDQLVIEDIKFILE